MAVERRQQRRPRREAICGWMRRPRRHDARSRRACGTSLRDRSANLQHQIGHRPAAASAIWRDAGHARPGARRGRCLPANHPADRAEGHDLEHAVAGRAHRRGEREQLVALGEGAGHRARPCSTDARRCGRSRSRARRPPSPRRRGAPSRRCPRRSRSPWLQRALAHDADAQRRMGDLGWRHPSRSALAEPIEIIAEAAASSSPCPRRGRRRECPRRLPSARSARGDTRGAAGAKPTPQLPAIAVVTPLEKLGSILSSHRNWPS